MGKLNGLVCYQVGPIDYADDFGMGWRTDITPWLERFGVSVLNPTLKIEEAQHTLARRKQLKQNAQYEELALQMKEIRHIDLRCCDCASFAICYIDMSIPMTGTMEELFWLNRCKKPTLIYAAKGMSNLSDWLFGTIPLQHIFENWQDLYSYLEGIDGGMEDVTGRWVFLS